MIEEWKELSFCKDYYISNLGNIKHNDMIVFKSINYNKKDYPIFFFPRDKVQGFPGKRVHRLVAEYFIPNPLNKKYINHKDFNKCNNSILNLEWVTASENSQHLVKGGRHRGGWKDFTKEQRSGQNNPMYGKRFKCMNDSNINKYIPLNEVDKYLKEGWKFGRLHINMK